jgi:hypothetical protein
MKNKIYLLCKKMFGFKTKFTVKTKYIALMGINSMINSCCSVISTNSMLSSVIKTPSYTDIISLNYIGKDILGQLGGLFFVLKTAKNSDKKPVKYISQGIITQQIAYNLENSLPLISNSNFLLPCLGFSSLLKNISFISIGAVNANNLQKLESKNIGELYSKVSIINTLFSSIGMISGLGIIYLVPSYSFRSYVILPCLGILSIYTIRKATKMVN